MLRRAGFVRRDWASGYLWVELLPLLEWCPPYFTKPRFGVRALLASISHKNPVEVLDSFYLKLIRRIPVAQTSVCAVLVWVLRGRKSAQTEVCATRGDQTPHRYSTWQAQMPEQIRHALVRNFRQEHARVLYRRPPSGFSRCAWESAPPRSCLERLPGTAYLFLV